MGRGCWGSEDLIIGIPRPVPRSLKMTYDVGSIDIAGMYISRLSRGRVLARS